MPSGDGLTLMGGDTGLTHLIQELHESFQNGSVEALNVRPQVWVSEEYGKESSVLVGGRVEFLKPMFGIRNRGYHVGRRPMISVHLGVSGCGSAP